jgi:hypothetical protein
VDRDACAIRLGSKDVQPPILCGPSFAQREVEVDDNVVDNRSESSIIAANSQEGVS